MQIRCQWTEEVHNYDIKNNTSYSTITPHQKAINKRNEEKRMKKKHRYKLQRSTFNLLLQLATACTKAVDAGRGIDVVSLDIACARCRVWHAGITFKLKGHGTDGDRRWPAQAACTIYINRCRRHRPRICDVNAFSCHVASYLLSCGII